MEEKELAFHEAVRRGYLALAVESPRWLVIDATQPASTIHNEIMQQVQQRISKGA
jgi:thymidylate kinase